MQTFIKTALAAALSIAAISPAMAGDEPIVVHSEAAMKQWQADVTRSFDRRLANAERQMLIRPANGIVQLRFTLDADGKPEDIETITSSGHRGTDAIARRAVQGLDQLDEAPVTNVADQVFIANVIFAQDSDQKTRLAAKLAKMEGARLAMSTDGTSAISFGG